MKKSEVGIKFLPGEVAYVRGRGICKILGWEDEEHVYVETAQGAFSIANYKLVFEVGSTIRSYHDKGDKYYERKSNESNK